MCWLCSEQSGIHRFQFANIFGVNADDRYDGQKKEMSPDLASTSTPRRTTRTGATPKRAPARTDNSSSARIDSIMAEFRLRLGGLRGQPKPENIVASAESSISSVEIEEPNLDIKATNNTQVKNDEETATASSSADVSKKTNSTNNNSDIAPELIADQSIDYSHSSGQPTETDNKENIKVEIKAEAENNFNQELVADRSVENACGSGESKNNDTKENIKSEIKTEEENNIKQELIVDQIEGNACYSGALMNNDIVKQEGRVLLPMGDPEKPVPVHEPGNIIELSDDEDNDDVIYMGKMVFPIEWLEDDDI